MNGLFKRATSLSLLLAAPAALATTTNSVEALSGSLPDMGLSAIRAVGALALVLALFFGGVWAYRNGQRLAWRNGRAPKLAVIESRQLGNRLALHVVGYEQKRLLIGSSPAGLTLLGQMPPASETEPPGAAGLTSEQLPFAEHLAQPLKRELLPAAKTRVARAKARQPKRRLASARNGAVRACLLLLVLAVALFGASSGSAQTNATSALMPLHISLGTGSQAQDLDLSIRILFAITLLSLAPSIILLMTCFTRIIIVLSFIRTALQLQAAPANQILIGLSLFMTFFIMSPVWDNINRDAITPYRTSQISGDEALERASVHVRSFMLKQARAKDVELFVALAKMPPTPPDQLPLRVVIPGFVISELRTAFQMGFLILVPFILIDLVVSTVLMSMGMMMLPPATIAMPLKILLFVLVDGWALIVRSLVMSFGG